MEELKDLVPQAAEVRAGGELFEITPFKFGQIPKVMRIMGEAFASLQSEEVPLEELLESAGDQVMDLVALATGKDRDWVAGLLPDEGLRLVTAVLEVNGDFFMRRLGPVLDDLKGALGGLKSSSSSLPTATPIARSSGTPPGRSPSSSEPHTPDGSKSGSIESETPAPPLPSQRPSSGR